jgi:hypothetical protein
MERYHSNDQFGDACDPDALFHPSHAFGRPSEVVNHPDLTLNEKRAILASWASDACAIEAVSTLRRLPGGKRPVHFDEVMDALRALDEEATEPREPGSEAARTAAESLKGQPRRGMRLFAELTIILDR